MPVVTVSPNDRIDTNTTLDREWMDAEEFRRRMNLGRTTFYHLARTNALPVPTIRAGRQLRFSRRAYERLLDAQHDAE